MSNDESSHTYHFGYSKKFGDAWRRYRMSKELFIRDDLGYAWTFDSFNGRIRLAGEVEEGSGLYCASWEEGIRILNAEGYITADIPLPKISRPDETEDCPHCANGVKYRATLQQEQCFKCAGKGWRYLDSGN